MLYTSSRCVILALELLLGHAFVSWSCMLQSFEISLCVCVSAVGLMIVVVTLLNTSEVL